MRASGFCWIVRVYRTWFSWLFYLSGIWVVISVCDRGCWLLSFYFFCTAPGSHNFYWRVLSSFLFSLCTLTFHWFPIDRQESLEWWHSPLLCWGHEKTIEFPHVIFFYEWEENKYLFVLTVRWTMSAVIVIGLFVTLSFSLTSIFASFKEPARRFLLLILRSLGFQKTVWRVSNVESYGGLKGVLANT